MICKGDGDRSCVDVHLFSGTSLWNERVLRRREIVICCDCVVPQAFYTTSAFPGQKFFDPVQEKLVVETPGQPSENAVRPKLRGDFWSV